jgi:hypothetical protein
MRLAISKYIEAKYLNAMADQSITNSRKVDVARRQLGTALHLYLADLDPVSVHVLASGGSEVASAMAVKSNAKPFSDFTLEVFPNVTKTDLTKLRTKLWNAMKHANKLDGKERDDEDLLSTPLTAENEALLAEGWFDLAQAGVPLPLEAQAFNLWYLAKHGDHRELDGWQDELFPNILSSTPAQQKHMLIELIGSEKDNSEVMKHAQTDARPLILA